MDRSLPGPSVPGILQARILEWIAVPSSRGASQPRDRTCVSKVSCVGKITWIEVSSGAAKIHAKALFCRPWGVKEDF